MSLRGQYGTFLLSDPSAKAPLGTGTTATITGSSGDSNLTCSMTGTLKAGDYIQLGDASDATLHKVLLDYDGDVDEDTSEGLDVWPKLRKDRTAVTATLTNPSGVFRLASNETSWSVNNASFYGISFSAYEVI